MVCLDKKEKGNKNEHKMFIWNKELEPELLNDEFIAELRRQGVVE
jgi:hypothetical protein